MSKITLMFSLLIFLPFTLAADGYLDALSNESKDLSVDSATLSNKNKYKNRIVRNTIPAQLAKDNFNSYLWENYYETYLRLNKLNFFKKQSVYSQYLKLSKPDIDAIEDLIKQTS